jgi:Flp pilus assembly protein TadG
MDGLERKRNPPAMDIGLFRRCDGGVGAARARHRLWRDRSGATAVIVALSAPILLAMAGLGVDAGFWYTIKRQNQSAADAAAISAAYEVAYATGNQLAAATQAATANGWVNNTNPPAGLTPIAVYYPCTSSTCTFAAGGIQVVLQQQQPTWLANFASLANVTITNSAVAVVSNLPPACMLALNPTLADAINLAGNPTINAPSCTRRRAGPCRGKPVGKKIRMGERAGIGVGDRVGADLRRMAQVERVGGAGVRDLAGGDHGGRGDRSGALQMNRARSVRVGDVRRLRQSRRYESRLRDLQQSEHQKRDRQPSGLGKLSPVGSPFESWISTMPANGPVLGAFKLRSALDEGDGLGKGQRGEPDARTSAGRETGIPLHCHRVGDEHQALVGAGRRPLEGHRRVWEIDEPVQRLGGVRLRVEVVGQVGQRFVLA